MAKHRSPFTEWVYREWEPLVLSAGAALPMDERWRLWANLHSKCRENGKWIIPLRDAALVASLGMTVAFENGRYEEAFNRGQELLDYAREMGEEDDGHNAHFVSRQVLALLMMGSVGEAEELIADYLGKERFRMPRIFEAELRGPLCGWLQELPAQEPVEDELRRSIAEMLSILNDPTSAERSSEARTAGEMAEVLLGSFYKVPA